MYYIYTDEAGISEPEPVTVVVGVVVHADRHWRIAANWLNEVLDEYVPQPIRLGFVFHAKDVWSGYRDYDHVWSREQRADLIRAVASIPRFIGGAVCIGKVRRDSLVPEDAPLRREDFQHVMAFWLCVARANKYVRDWGDPTEVATIVAENVPKNRKYLKGILSLPDFQPPIGFGDVILTKKELESGEILQTRAGNIDRIVDTVHFVGKSEAPLVQLADACAFSFRRYLSGQSYGEEFVEAILGEPSLIWDEWQGPSSSMTFSFNPDHAYPM